MLRNVTRSLLVVMTHLQLFDTYGGVPGGPSRRLFVCAGNDWWSFLDGLHDDFCPRHGPQYRRPPIPGTNVQGPCPGCGRPTLLRSYDPARHGWNDLRCLRCFVPADG